MGYINHKVLSETDDAQYMLSVCALTVWRRERACARGGSFCLGGVAEKWREKGRDVGRRRKGGIGILYIYKGG
jgi:hypothetical protein